MSRWRNYPNKNVGACSLRGRGKDQHMSKKFD